MPVPKVSVLERVDCTDSNDQELNCGQSQRKGEYIANEAYCNNLALIPVA